MSTELKARDELDEIHSRLLADAKDHPTYANDEESAIYGYSEGAEHALDTVRLLGYQKPRTVTTPEELRELPDGSVLMSGDRIRRYSGAIWRVRDGFVSRVGKELDGVTPFRYFVDPLPVTVIHEPGATR